MLWDGLRNDNLQTVATDHVGFNLAQKKAGKTVDKLLPGMSNLETHVADDMIDRVCYPWLELDPAEDSRGLVTIAIKHTATESAKVIPIPRDLPHLIHLARAIARPPNPVPSV